MADSIFIENNPNLKCYPMLVNNNALHHTTNLPLIITNNLEKQNVTKCYFFKFQIHYFSHLISQGDVSAVPEN